MNTKRSRILLRNLLKEDVYFFAFNITGFPLENVLIGKGEQGVVGDKDTPKMMKIWTFW